ncbi:MBL fold metallo-hydrolase [Halobacillus salinarum]|uniref:MBL fold metallo-hydrolase n=1 Tax=Halobacillus salinarum TaxID=2932257 RepID=A0ABY4EEU0_9BACI|nr:MBL fold metallo-hydrolase [Halobacillus salinarum]UOQ42634.1 MBL fold metallo-hydrolase [Halobacillus salinarum]
MQTMKDMIHTLTLPTPYAVGEVHCYLLIGSTVTLVDAGVKTSKAWEELKSQLKRLDIEPEDVEQIILTHHHPDHMGLIESFPHLRTIAGHYKLRPWLERSEQYLQRYEQFFTLMYEEAGVPETFHSFLKTLRKPLKWTAQSKLTLELQEGDKIPGHEDWETIETPGHAQSHLSFFRSADGALLGGDHLLPHISSNPLLEPPFQPGSERPKPLLQYRHSMDKILRYSVSRVYPGHGQSFSGAHELIHKRFKSQEARAEKVKKIIGSHSPMNAYQVCEHLFTKQMGSQFGLTMSETIGQLDYLESIQEIASSYDSRQKLYYVN